MLWYPHNANDYDGCMEEIDDANWLVDKETFDYGREEETATLGDSTGYDQ